MPEILAERSNDQQVSEQAAFIKKRFALLSFLDVFFYCMVFCLLLVSPANAVDSLEVNSSEQNTHIANNTDISTDISADISTDISIYAAHVTEELQALCQTKSTKICDLNVLSQTDLLTSLRAADTSGEVFKSLKGTEYELLVSSTKIIDSAKDTLVEELLLEISAQWRGITLNDIQLTVVLDKNISDTKQRIAKASNKLFSQWIKSASNKQLFSAEYLYQFLGASDYKNELRVPNKIGNFSLSRQHLFNDPMKGMLSRYIHSNFELAVFDVYVYPLKTNDSPESQSQNELKLEQQDIRAISKALGKDALVMSDIYTLKNITALQDTQVFVFEAQLKTNSDPLYATQYLYVKSDKVVKFSTNAPARITNHLIADAINAIIVPAESSLMRQVRRTEVEQLSSTQTSVAP
jgi:hypothetical protein